MGCPKSLRMLDILDKFLIGKGYSFSRDDGSTPTGLRQSLVDDFNSSPSKQDFKEFQGELFGISNLFRDLSGKLFTSRIIQKHGTQREDRSEIQSLPDIGTCFLPQQARDTFSLESFDKNTNKSSAPVNQQLGIVYAHRNEDIISHERGCDVQHHESTSAQVHSCSPHAPKKKPSTFGEKGDNASLKEQKLKQYRYIARFMGMEVVEFSKWFLSASFVEREQVLQNYKRPKEKKPIHIVHAL